MKTRLAATVGVPRALEIYRELVAAVCRKLPRDVEITVMFDPWERRFEFERWLPFIAEDINFRYNPQYGEGTGLRLIRAFEQAFASHRAPVLGLATDCVDVGPAIFQEAWTALETHDLVIGPTWDGGYYLLGLNHPHPELFRDIAWGTDMMLPQTLARAEALSLTAHLLPILHDVDTEETWREVEPRLHL